MSTSDPVAVSILDKEYVIACPEDQKEDLISSAHYLDERMRETRDSGKALGTERMAVMTALNIVNEYLREKKEKLVTERAIDDCVKALDLKISKALGRP